MVGGLLKDNIKYDGKMLTRETLAKQLRLYLAVKRTSEEMGFDLCGIKGRGSSPNTWLYPMSLRCC